MIGSRRRRRSRRRQRLLLALVSSLAALSLAACGSSGSEGQDAGEVAEVAEVAEPTSSDGPQGLAGEGTFPTTVEHRYGSTTIEAEPQRVVSVGLTEQDVLLQLGVVPVGVTDWYGDQPSATWPWARELLGEATPEVLSQSDGIEFEEVAALQPDLIVGTNSGMTERDYELLSDIAPTVTSVEGSTLYFSSWQDQVLQVARALGREADGETLISGVEDKYAAVAEQHPEWAGLSATFSQGGPYDGQLYVYPDGLGTDFLTDLGFSMTPGLDAYAPDAGSQALISAENVGLIDADVIVFATEDQDMFDELQGFSTVADLDAVSGQRAIYTDDVLAGAIYFLTPLSLEYVLDELTPRLEDAVAGTAPIAFDS